MFANTKIKANAFTSHNSVKLVRGGAAYFNLIDKMADNAQFSILFQTYIFDEDETGNRVATTLIRAANRGVIVYLLVDAYASQHLSDAFIVRLREAGIHFSFFKPVFKTRDFYIGRRLHHKIIITDAQKCMVAGLNISNRYNDINGIAAWMDWAIYAEGEVAYQLQQVAIAIWDKSVFREKVVDAIIDQMPPQLPEINKANCQVRIRRNDWINRQIEITKSYTNLFKSANKKVILMTGYFGPSNRLLRKMAAAAKRGADVSFILTTIADVPFAKAAERYMYKWLLRHGIKIFEYKDNILHGKIAVFDMHIVTGGSYNINNISARASVELNLEVKNEAFAKEVEDALQQVIDNSCTPITMADCITHNGYIEQLNQWLSYQIIHLIFYMFTFYFRQAEAEKNK